MQLDAKSLRLLAVGSQKSENSREFFGFSENLHIRQLDGSNNHHIIEGIFKSFAKALDEATITDNRIDGLMSTKGAL